MLWVMSQEEIDALNERVRQLYASDQLADLIQGVLMDMSIGKHGMYEEVAALKAQKIAEMVNARRTPDPLAERIAKEGAK